jgi:ribosomal protein L11 methyltransferase
MAVYPALDVHGGDGDLALAAADDFSPTAAEVVDDTITIYFGGTELRDRAAAAVSLALPGAIVTARDVDDGDWARRSQANLAAVVVGRIIVEPGPPPVPPAASPQSLQIVIQPSMGFGTGHHATTRLCLTALQRLTLEGRTVLDVGTGSGILAIAARALGARQALGIDCDPDAIRSARDNLELNPGIDAVSFEIRDLSPGGLPVVDVVAANLTGALLCRTATTLADLVAPAGHLILSGVLAGERDAVVAAFAGLDLSWEASEGEWVGLCFNRSSHDTV